MFEVTPESMSTGKRGDVASDARVQPINPVTVKVACSNCNLRELCMPMGLKADELDRIEEVVAVRRKVKRGSRLYSNGEKFSSLFAIRTGFFKPASPPKTAATRSPGSRWQAKSSAWTALSRSTTPVTPSRWKMLKCV